MSMLITFEEALKEGKIHLGDYFVTTAYRDSRVIVPESITGSDEEQYFETRIGTRCLWRLDEEIKMVGEPTKKELTLRGQEGFERGINTINRVAKELYEVMRVFEQVQSCAFPKENYTLSELHDILQAEQKRYQHPDDRGKRYWIASRCIEVYCNKSYFNILAVNSRYVGNFNLHCSYGLSNSYSFAIRPEAIPSPTMLLEIEWRDGSKDKPWKCC